MIAKATPSEFQRIAEKVLGGERITSAEGVWLIKHAPVHELASLAHTVRDRKMSEAGRKDLVTYVISRNINYTNVCITDCDFCSFYRHPLADGAYSLTPDELKQKAQETLDLGGTEILLQGGHNPKLPLKYYQDMLGQFESMGLHNHAFSPSEIQHFAKFWQM
ncbi:MAG: dehypoxanthine futalosine cyclase, partial [Planctomycetes bacterium]|nr:dehypoxanthine futalosine cyclase [Planctomycetota bacterium]